MQENDWSKLIKLWKKRAHTCPITTLAHEASKALSKRMHSNNA